MLGCLQGIIETIGDITSTSREFLPRQGNQTLIHLIQYEVHVHKSSLTKGRKDSKFLAIYFNSPHPPGRICGLLS